MTHDMASSEITLNGKRIPLKLTLGALAELEETLGADTLAELAVKIANPSARQLIAILTILARAAGGEVAAGTVAGSAVSLRAALSVIARLLREVMEAPVPGKSFPGGKGGVSG